MILFNNMILPQAEFSEELLRTGLNIYEVVRVFNGKPIFLKDNLTRLANSLKKSNIPLEVEKLNIADKLKHLIELKKMQEGNIKYVLHFDSDQMDECIYQIPHHYPSFQDYQKGVPTLTYEITRKNPEVKYINEELRTLTNQLIADHNVYEILLVDQEGYITEGSRSNVFFIKDQILYTSPTAYVLPGTSRKRVFEICQKHNYSIVEQRIDFHSLEQYDSVFLTGTSPLILPINQINTIRYAVDTPFLRQLMDHYFALLEK